MKIQQLLYVSSVAAYGDFFGFLCGAIIGNSSVSPCLGADWYMQEPSCFCHNEEYLSSLYQCISLASEMVGNKGAIGNSWHALHSTCGENKEKVISLEAVRKLNPPNATYGIETTKETLVDGNVLKTGEARHLEAVATDIYAYATLAYIFGMILVAIIFNLASFLTPRALYLLENSYIARPIRQYVTIPALFGRSCAQAVELMPEFFFDIPARIPTLMLIGYICLVIVLLAVNFHCELSRYYSYFEAPSWVIGYWLGQRTGVYATVQLPMLILFAGRNNVLQWLTGWNHSEFLLWHRWTARVFTAEVGVHAITYTVYRGLQGRLPRVFTAPYWIWGLIAAFSAFFLCLTGITRSVRTASYDLFIVVHFCLAVICVLGTWIHLSLLTEEVLKALYATVAIWGFDRAVRLLRIAYNGFFGVQCHVRILPGDMLELTIHSKQKWRARAGHYAFIHFGLPLHWWQSHPFTLIEPEKGVIRLYAGVHSGITRAIRDRVLNGQSSFKVWIDGPYGVPVNLSRFDRIVFIAGGAGITAIGSQIMHELHEIHDDLWLYWAIRNESPLEWFSDELSQMKNVHITANVSNSASKSKGTPSVDSEEQKFLVTKEATSSYQESPRVEVQHHRMDVPSVVAEHISHASGSTCFFVCGPAGMADEVRQSVASNLSNTNHYVQFFEETFIM